MFGLLTTTETPRVIIPFMATEEFLGFRELMRTALVERFGKEAVCPFWGNQTAKVVSISQAPSASVIKNQRPFSDKSGEKLRNIWYQVPSEIFYNPDNFYFTAVGMYFPGKDKKGGDLKPSLEFAREWLPKELNFLSPKLFLIVGRLAAEFFFHKENFRDLVFADQVISGKLAFVLPHPSPLNIKWLKDNPEFEKVRLPTIRKIIRGTLGLYEIDQ